MFGNMHAIILTQNAGNFINFLLFWHGVSLFLFYPIKESMLDIRKREKGGRKTFLPHMRALFSAIN